MGEFYFGTSAEISPGIDTSEAITSAIRLLVRVSSQSTLTSASKSRRYRARNVVEKRG